MADEVQVDPAVESSARGMGWVPLDQFRGDKERWVDAETYVKRGEEVLPLLKANNKNLQAQVASLTAQLNETKTLVQSGQEAIAGLKEAQTEFSKAAVSKAKSDLRAQLRVAREANDMDMIGEIEDQLDDIREAEREVKAAPAPAPAAAPAAAPKPDPEFTAWLTDNPWYNVDKRRTTYMLAEAQLLRADAANNGLAGRAFYEQAAANADAVINPRKTDSKVESGSGTGSAPPSGSGTGKKTFKDLPSDARAVCERQAATLVGEGRAFKTKPEWQQYYADEYFKE